MTKHFSGFSSRRLNNFYYNNQLEINTRTGIPWRFLLVSFSIIPTAVSLMALPINATPTGMTNQTENNTSQLGQATSNNTVGWQTHQDSQNGFTIQYPPDWREDESPFALVRPALYITPDDESTSKTERTTVIIEVEEQSRTLDPTTLEVTSLPVEHHANTFIQGMRSIGDGMGNLDLIKNEAPTFLGEPAWNVEYISSSGGYQLGYGNIFFVIKDDKLYDVGFSTAPLKVPEMRPTGEKNPSNISIYDSRGSGA